MRTAQDVVDLFHQRRRHRSPILDMMMQVRDQYNDDLVVPLPELDKKELPFVANLIKEGLDHQAQRASEVMPDLSCPPLSPRQPTSVARAKTREMAIRSWWQQNGYQRQMRRRARFLIGYGTAPVRLCPDFDKEIPYWEIRNPLNAFPAATVNPDDMCPADTIYAVKKPLAWLRANYPDKAKFLLPDTWRADHKITVLEYDDAEQIMVVVLNQDGPGMQTPRGYAQYLVLEQMPNLAGMPLSIHPGRITLDRLKGQFDSILGMAQMQAKLMALDVIAVQKGVFPPMALVGNQPGQPATLLDGTWHDGASGEINTIIDGDLHEYPVQPGFATGQSIDRLERYMRIGGGVPSDTTGESTSGVRTGRRGDSILSATLDPGLQETQETFAASAEAEIRVALSMSKAYWGNTPKSFHVKKKGPADYTPNKDFDSDVVEVTYPVPGSDANNLIIGVGQRVGLGTMSIQTAMRLDPYVDDVDREQDQITVEGLQRALVQLIEQQAGTGQIVPSDLARIMQLVKVENMDLDAAVDKVHKEAQDRQAKIDAAGAPTAVDPNSPAAQPGLAAPGAGAEAGAAIQQPPTSLSNLDTLMQSLKGSGQTIPGAA